MNKINKYREKYLYFKCISNVLQAIFHFTIFFLITIVTFFINNCNFFYKIGTISFEKIEKQYQ